ncbi:Uncharacterised protein [Chlamydia trachomatis]|nr:Uncharacterised protein [Chlamydia trachomatis]
MAACHLVTNGDLATLGDVDANGLSNARVEFVFFVVEFADADDDAFLAVRNTQGGIANLAGFLTEDCAQKAFFGGELSFTLRGDLANENVASGYLGTNTDNATLVEVSE